MRPRVTDRLMVIETGRRCLAQHGIRGTTMDHVADAAGISRATLYRYMGTKDDLIREVLLIEVLELMEAVRRATEEAQSADAFVRGAVGSALRCIRARPVLARGLADVDVLIPQLTTESDFLIRACASALVPLFDHARERGVIAFDLPVKRVAEDLVRFSLSLLHTPLLEGDGTDPERGADRAAAVFVPMLQP